MNTITDYLTHDHRRCDDLFVTAENHVCKQAWSEASTCFSQFRAGIEHHFEMEEQVLFPAFEQKTGSTEGPTEIMRNEHRQIRAIIEMLMKSLALQEKDEYLGHSETMNIMIQQHNMKEENILYPMTDQLLGKIQPDMIDAMNKLDTGG